MDFTPRQVTWGMEMNLGDIAREAGVSRATVSRVINGSSAVKSSTAQAVSRTIDRLGYVRPSIRPGPKPRPTNSSKLRLGSIALITMGLTRHLLQEPTMAFVIDEIQSACRKRQLNFLLDQMTSAHEMPNCVRSRQIDGAIVMISGRPPNLRECLTKLADMVPSVHLFSPGHPVASMDHVSVNDVAIGELAFQTLKSEGCRSMAVINTSTRFHEALFVRGRALADRAAQEGIVLRIFTVPPEVGTSDGFWPQPQSVFQDLSSLATSLREMPGTVGVFLNSETAAAKLHKALRHEGLLSGDDGHVRLIVAGSTADYVRELDPKPLLIDLCFPELIAVAVDRLVHRATHLPAHPLTFLVAPKLASETEVHA